ncbi:MAG: sodium-dependent transporter [Coriobacteriales bacterium]|nr:sodium-dependent transporter [Coriobacteriales bacterium]
MDDKQINQTAESFEKKTNRISWSGKLAFVLASAGSAIGLGNLWRFPYLAAKYGGSCFLIVYIILGFTFGISLLLLETALGRKTGMSVIEAFQHYGKKYKIIGILGSIVPFIITPYYCVIGGWVVKYMFSYVTDGSAALADGGGYFTSFITSPDFSFVFMGIFMLVTVLIVAFAKNGAIEKANFIMLPALFVMAIAITIYIAMQPGAADGIAYYLIPDFSRLSPELFISALGQIFFSFSLAMGIMVTYGSYLNKKDSLTTSCAQVTGCNILIAILGGFIVVPSAFVAMGGAEAVMAKGGPSLMFVTLPTVFDSMGAVAPVIGFVFFLLVLFAALTSSISLVETLVSILEDTLKWERKRSMIVVIIYLFVVGTFVNSGYNFLSFIAPLGEGSSLLDLFDFVSNTVLMPIVALLTCIFVGYIIKPKELIDEIKISSPFKLEKAWVVMIKFVCPVLVVITLVAYVAAQFGFFSM